jgi:hypothetical protein
MRSAAGLLSSWIMLLAGCSDTGSIPAAAGPPKAASRNSSTADSNKPWFEEVTKARGLPPPTAGYADGTFATFEITPGGVALFDYDNDGRLDILQICHPPPGHFDETVPNRLFHQEPDGSFREIPNAGGLNGPGYAMGVAIGDYNNDGLPDVFITRFGHCSLYRNNGDGTFTDVTARAGLATDKAYWCSSAAWVDYDRDGWLDLFVGRFAEFDPTRQCGDNGQPDYCGPNVFQGVGCKLYHNNRDGTFTDVTAKAGLNVPDRAWGVVCADFTGDGWPDIFVANDEERQNLWINQHDGTFKDEALQRGVAFSGAGNPEAGMGVGIGDITSDSRLSLLITHIRNEKNTVYMPIGNGLYADKSAVAGMAAIDMPYTGWGCGLVDFDNDGNLDVAVVNGRVVRGPVDPRAKLGQFWNAYAESNLLFRGDGQGHFTNMTTQGGDFTRHVECTRGMAFGDIDNNGRICMVTNTLDNTLRLYRNVAPSEGNHWLSVRALTGKRDALGARLELRAGKHRWTQLVLSTYSFLSSNDPRAHFGLGPVDHVDSLEALWPDGTQEQFDVPGVDRQLTIRQGTGRK